MIGHRVPPLVSSFTFEPPATPANARYEVKFFLAHKETDPSNGVTRFVPKGERQVNTPSGTPSFHRWTAFQRAYQGGVWQGRARVSIRALGGGLTYLGEGSQEVSIPYDVPPSGGATMTFRFTAVPDASAVGGLRVEAIAP